ncbi:MAG: hypothetical protein Q9174_003870 [Haloplaca sp. 1 TL-2023]
MAPVTFETTFIFPDGADPYMHPITISYPQLSIPHNPTVSLTDQLLWMFGIAFLISIAGATAFIIGSIMSKALPLFFGWISKKFTGDHTQCVKTGTKHSHLLCNMKRLLSFVTPKRPHWRHRPEKKAQVDDGNEKGYDARLEGSDEGDTLTNLGSVRTPVRCMKRTITPPQNMAF